MTTPAPSPSPGLWPRATAQAFTPFADPKVLHFPCPTSRAARSPFSWASLLCVWHPPGGKRKHRAALVALKGSQAQVPSLGSGAHSPAPPPPKSDLLWPLRHVLFLTPSWNWLSSSKNQALFLVVPTRPQLPVKRELIYIFIYLLFVLGWVCVQSQGVRCSHCRLGECLADLDLGATILPLPLWLPSVFDSRCSFESPSSRSMCPRLDTDPLLKQVARAKAPGGKDVPAPHLEGWPFCHGFSPALCPLPPAIPVKG